MKIAVLQGPNLNRLGKRRPDKYGRKTLADITAELDVLADKLGVEIVQTQSNHEGGLIDWLHEVQDDIDGILINPAGLTPYGRSLYDSLKDAELPIAIVHMSAIFQYEKQAHPDMYADLASIYIAGLKSEGYGVALEHLVELIRTKDS